MHQRILLGVLGLVLLLSPTLSAQRIVIDETMSPPNWALLQRELLRANVAACKEFYSRYFDDNGWLLCVERWGGDDGPDDAAENMIYWLILHASGADDSILHMFKKSWEGHLQQYTRAKTVEVPFARDGMYYKEFPVMMDWLHNAEGLVGFMFQGLSDPYNDAMQKRVRRYAGFYMNEDPQAPNYDPKHKIIRSLFNGSRGPLLRKATGLDWAGDPIEVEGRFELGHEEENYEQMVFHFKDYNDIVGDHPSNLMATSLAFKAYMIDHKAKYKDWVLEYVRAWHDRMIENGDIIPTNVGLDGKIGSDAGGKWYGGVYGWGFTVEVPQTGAMDSRQTFNRGIHGFMNAVMLTGDLSVLDPWRRQMDKVNSNKKVIDGKVQYPRKYGDNGWYEYSTTRFHDGAGEIYYATMREEDYARLPNRSPWWEYLRGNNPGYPESVLRADFEHIRGRIARMRTDTTTPDTRLSDDPLKYNPVAARSLTQLMMGGIYPGRDGMILYARLRYFDPIRRRAGVPEDVAALIDSMTDEETVVTLVNTSQTETRRVVVQGGGYAEHQIVAATYGGKRLSVNDSQFTVILGPGAGGRLTLKMRRYVNQPTLMFPWDR